MEGKVKHPLFAKFRDDTTLQQREQFIKNFANLKNLIPQIKTFCWGKNIITENRNDGLTDVFYLTFDNMDDVWIYLRHPDHVNFALTFEIYLDNFIFFDYVLTPVIVDSKL